MLNCAHPAHFDAILDPTAAWIGRLRGLRANASTLSHAELDEMEVLDAGDPPTSRARYAELGAALPACTSSAGAAAPITATSRRSRQRFAGRRPVS